MSDPPTPWDRWVRRLCRAAAAGGIPGGCIQQEDAAWCRQGLGSEPCSPVLSQGAQMGHSGTVFLVSILQSPEEAVEPDNRAGRLEQQPCWDAAACWGPEDLGGMGAAAWPDDQSRRFLRGEEIT